MFGAAIDRLDALSRAPLPGLVFGLFVLGVSWLLSRAMRLATVREEAATAGRRR